MQKTKSGFYLVDISEPGCSDQIYFGQQWVRNRLPIFDQSALTILSANYEASLGYARKDEDAYSLFTHRFG